MSSGTNALENGGNGATERNCIRERNDEQRNETGIIAPPRRKVQQAAAASRTDTHHHTRTQTHTLFVVVVGNILSFLYIRASPLSF